MSARIGLTIKSTELRPGEVMSGGTVAGEPCWLWSPSEGRGWHLNEGRVDVPWNVDGWPLASRHDGVFTGAIVAVDVWPRQVASAPVDEILGCSYGASDSLLIAALRAHPDPLGLLARAKIALPWAAESWGACRHDVAGREVATTQAAEGRPAEDARLLADGWRLL